MSHTWRLGVLASVVVGTWLVPTWSEAAAASTVFAPVAGIFASGIALVYVAMGLVIAGLMVYTISRALNAREQGDWLWYAITTVALATFAFVLMPAVLAPSTALGATLAEVQPTVEIVLQGGGF